MYSTELKIKRLSLGAEARIIRQEEKRLKARRKTEALRSLHEHRISTVRRAARSAHLAHAYLRCLPYARVEDPERTRTMPPVSEVVENLRRFGGWQFASMEKPALAKAVAAWIDGGAPVGVAASNPQTVGSSPIAASTI